MSMAMLRPFGIWCGHLCSAGRRSKKGKWEIGLRRHFSIQLVYDQFEFPAFEFPAGAPNQVGRGYEFILRSEAHDWRILFVRHACRNWLVSVVSSSVAALNTPKETH
jgi:hypothetical protein